MKREELVKSREYWIADVQLKLFEVIDKFMAENNINRTQLAEKLGVTKGYITQVLNGDFDHKISKMVDLALACDAIPIIDFKNVDDFIGDEICTANFQYNGIRYQVDLDMLTSYQIAKGQNIFNLKKSYSRKALVD